MSKNIEFNSSLIALLGSLTMVYCQQGAYAQACEPMTQGSTQPLQVNAVSQPEVFFLANPLSAINPVKPVEIPVLPGQIIPILPLPPAVLPPAPVSSIPSIVPAAPYHQQIPAVNPGVVQPGNILPATTTQPQLSNPARAFLKPHLGVAGSRQSAVVISRKVVFRNGHKAFDRAVAKCARQLTESEKKSLRDRIRRLRMMEENFKKNGDIGKASQLDSEAKALERELAGLPPYIETESGGNSGDQGGDTTGGGASGGDVAGGDPSGGAGPTGGDAGGGGGTTGGAGPTGGDAAGGGTPVGGGGPTGGDPSGGGTAGVGTPPATTPATPPGGQIHGNDAGLGGNHTGRGTNATGGLWDILDGLLNWGK